MDFTTEEKAQQSSFFYTHVSNGASPPPLVAFTPKKAYTTSCAKSFKLHQRELFDANLHISLTTIESLLLKQLTLSHHRVCSKKELILAINKDPSSYTGLEMCLSRLQNKFNDAYGERLFRSVRNRGYCLVQEVEAMPPTCYGSK